MGNSIGYYIKIVSEEQGYAFQFWYCGKQPMGWSISYKTYDECVRAIDDFKAYLSVQKPTVENRLAEVIKISSACYMYQFFNLNHEIIYTGRRIEAKVNCIKSMKSTAVNFIHAELKE